MRGFAQQIKKVYKQAVASLVVPQKSDLQRPTLWSSATSASRSLSFWDFPGLYERAVKGLVALPDASR